MEMLLILVAAGAAAYVIFKRRSPGREDGGRKAQGTIASSDWTMPFVLYHVATEMRLAGSGNMPNSVRGLAIGRVEPEDHQQLLASLQNYLSFAYGRAREVGDEAKAISTARDFLQAELRTANTPTATKRFIRKNHRRQTGLDISDAELAQQFQEISTAVTNDVEAGHKLRNTLLQDSVIDLFETRHKKQIDTFASDLARSFATA